MYLSSVGEEWEREWVGGRVRERGRGDAKPFFFNRK
jgi:hypothetical protein